MLTRSMVSALGIAWFQFLIGGVRPACSTPVYRIDDIGPPGHFSSLGTAPRINAAGQVVFTPSLVSMRYTDGIGLETLDIPGTRSSVSDINDRGQIVGTTIQDGKLFAYRYTEGSGVDALVPLVRAEGAGDISINALGQFAGSTGDRGYVYTDGEGVKMLPYRFVQDFNDRGDILASDTPANSQIPNGRYLYTEARGWEDIRPRLFTSGGASCLNDRGQMAGFQQITGSPATLRLVDVDTGVTHDLGSSSNSRRWLSGLNNHGQAVGVFHGNVPNQPFIASEEIGWRDLNTLIDPALGWKLDWASDINDRGQIVGLGHRAGEYRTFRLTPIPEPATLVLLAVGLLSLGRRRKT